MIHTLMMIMVGDTMATRLTAWTISSSWEKTSWWLQLSIQVCCCHFTITQSTNEAIKHKSIDSMVSQSHAQSFDWLVNAISCKHFIHPLITLAPTFLRGFSYPCVHPPIPCIRPTSQPSIHLSIKLYPPTHQLTQPTICPSIRPNSQPAS